MGYLWLTKFDHVTYSYNSNSLEDNDIQPIQWIEYKLVKIQMLRMRKIKISSNFTNIIPAVRGEVENPLSETGFRFRKWNYDNQTIVKS